MPLSQLVVGVIQVDRGASLDEARGKHRPLVCVCCMCAQCALHRPTVCVFVRVCSAPCTCCVLLRAPLQQGPSKWPSVPEADMLLRQSMSACAVEAEHERMSKQVRELRLPRRGWIGSALSMPKASGPSSPRQAQVCKHRLIMQV